jgi:hypothetical protein
MAVGVGAQTRQGRLSCETKHRLFSRDLLLYISAHHDTLAPPSNPLIRWAIKSGCHVYHALHRSPTRAANAFLSRPRQCSRGSLHHHFPVLQPIKVWSLSCNGISTWERNYPPGMPNAMEMR